MMKFGTSKIIVVEYQCPFCREIKNATYPTDGYTKWYMKGFLIQEAMPEVSATDREILISGICPECQKTIFGA